MESSIAGGLLSDKRMEDVADGVISFAVSPEVKITDLCVVDVANKKT